MQRWILLVVALAAALLLGLVVSIGMIDVFNVFLPPFRPEDDDTMREYFPVAVAMGIGALVSLVVSVVAWHRLRPR